MRKKLLTALSAVALLALVGTAATADTEASFPVIGVRSQGMGNAFVAVANDVSAIAWNPAGLAFIEDQQIEINHTDLYDLGIDFNYAAYAQHKFGVAWGHMDAGSFLFGGGDYTEDLFMFSGSHQVDPQTFVGGTLKWHKQKYSAPGNIDTTKATSWTDASSDGFSLDVAAMYRVDEATNVAIAVYDLFGELKSGINGKSHNLDPNITVGFSRRPNPDTLFALQISHLGEESYVHVGVEKKLQNELILRAGIDDEVFTAGLGFLHEKWEFDYSYKNKTSLGLDKTQRFGAKVHF